jgi:SagB-type dehydrogenase family enzyme
MAGEIWQEVLLPSGNEDHIWELFHENSKIGRHSNGLSNEEVRERMAEFHESLPFEGYPTVGLPQSLMPLPLQLDKAIVSRVSVRDLVPCMLNLETLSTLLHYAYGMTRENKNTTLPRPFRVVPSGGALYPLEIFFHTAYVEGLRAGLYHYNPSKNRLCLLQEKNSSQTISEALVQSNFAFDACLIIFITAIFERSVFKYGDRGYRFIFLEAGHVAQNVNLVAHALGFASVNIGGFLDRLVDDFLGLDGLTHSTVYIVAIGKAKEVSPKPVETLD